MRLEKIKLAGFKSFVDPTTVLFPSNLAGIVGPNGCGKSNVIDAVRWVMGESSAKMLRGQSMADVIFNGSTSRKPVGTAGIELMFDNSDGSAGGEYAKYNQIAVKRQVSRDGQSSYFLNGARCRRRDIQDLFLGTGLGPRSYAIIEQGMISRLIEAKPEDLRLFVEEAAGISKYKERRRETENRMRRTRDNLDRLDDLREEVAKQLMHLERQAATAERYKRLRQDERRLEAELKALRWRTLDREIGERDLTLGTREVALEGAVARQRHLEAEIEGKRDAYVEASDGFNEIQGRYYAVGSEIARIEQGIQFTKENRSRQEAELVRLRRELGEAQEHLGRDEQTLAELDAALAGEEPELVAADEGLAQAGERVTRVESDLKTWEDAWDEFNRRAAAPAELAQVERARINHLEQRMGQDRVRQTRTEEEIGRLSTAELASQIEVLEEQGQAFDTQLLDLQGEQGRIADALTDQERALRLAGEELDGARTGLQAARGRQASLSALQEAALRDADEAVADWLHRQGLDGAPRLADRLDVDDGWERAVEAALSGHLRAVCTEGLDRFAATSVESTGGALALLDTAGVAEGAAPTSGSLLDYVRSPWPLQGLLGTVRVAESLTDALSERAGLNGGETFVTRDGVLVGANWLRTPDSDNALGGVLARAEELKGLEGETDALGERVQALAEEQERLRGQRREIEADRDRLLEEAARLNKTLSGVRADLTGRRTRLEHQNERREALAAEQAELAERVEEALAESEEARERLHAALEEIETLADRRESLAAKREVLREEVARAREEEREWRERAHGLRVSIESRRASREVTARNLARAREQGGQLLERGEELRAGLEESLEPLAEQEAQLEEQLALRLTVEEQLGASRTRMEELDTGARGLEQERHRVEQDIQERQRELDALRLARQERLVRRRTLEEQLGEADLSPGEVLEGVAEDAEELLWQEQLEKIGARIQRLGNINLAAIDEFEEQSERKRYLDDQHADISRSLETLEQAIRRIDRETRHRFKETYDQVNHGLQQLFPRLFGGGHAYLELTGEDLLETGVSVMARPPGKRNASIQLLSGGEKALTAVALVFAIFQLNPAPFCMLDEVDAPLDDANVGRFCEMVRSMSDQVQFIFITHNKVTMEIADHLLGVTMNEPGVSRLVSVDVDEATRLAAVS
ncbi:MAG: chromosome segregation protein SMC [Pseudomonadota bacterium]|nr:chromosome segregation protein SMC [Pseudomonadota bacterium]